MIFDNVTDEALKEIYINQITSEEDGALNQSLRPYAKRVIEEWHISITMSEALSIAKRLFFDEVAKRYFEIR